MKITKFITKSLLIRRLQFDLPRANDAHVLLGYCADRMTDRSVDGTRLCTAHVDVYFPNKLSGSNMQRHTTRATKWKLMLKSKRHVVAKFYTVPFNAEATDHANINTTHLIIVCLLVVCIHALCPVRHCRAFVYECACVRLFHTMIAVQCMNAFSLITRVMLHSYMCIHSSTE